MGAAVVVMAKTVQDPDYAAKLADLVEGFEFELCHACGGDLGDHVISPDALGNPHAWCKQEGNG
jgi:hypothetical protein